VNEIAAMKAAVREIAARLGMVALDAGDAPDNPGERNWQFVQITDDEPNDDGLYPGEWGAWGPDGWEPRGTILVETAGESPPSVGRTYWAQYVRSIDDSQSEDNGKGVFVVPHGLLSCHSLESLDGYNAAKTQALMHVNSECPKWVDTEVC
jgi:hypothetical protein